MVNNSTDIPNQSNFTDDQNFKIDIEKVYTDIIKQIDAARSVINITNQNNSNILKALTKATSSKKESLTNIRQLLKVEMTAQESRCHAFYRLIGFPVVGKNDFYNPGLNNLPNKTTVNNIQLIRYVNSDFKINVINSLVDGFRELSTYRETYLSDIAKIFASNTTIDASVLALSSGTSVRKFAAASEKAKSTYNTKSDLDKADQGYECELLEAGLVGDIHVPLSEYMDAVGNKVKESTPIYKKSHIIIPFMVDPWIDLSVCPNANLVAVPFVFSKDNLRISENNYVKRPLLEKIIRDRFSDIPVDADGEYVKSLKEYIKLVPSIQDSKLIDSVITTAKGNEQIQFRRYLNIIMEMISKLVAAQNTITKAQRLYYWLPKPSAIGPEGGIVNRPIMSQFSKEISDANLLTDNDNELINANISQTMDQISSQVQILDGVPDIGDFALTEAQETFSPETTECFGDRNAEVIANLNKKRDRVLNDAGNALRTVEIIMGEFSGLGLCDIVAILGSLYIMPKDKILGFLDKDAFNRASAILGLKVNKPDLKDALKSYTDTVKDFYNLMDKLYQDQVNTNNQS